MPTVQRYGPRRVAPIALVGGRRTAVETPTSTGAGLAIAQAEGATTLGHVGASLARLGVAEAARLHQEEQDRADEITRLEMDNAFDQFERQAIFDPQTGALTVRGQAALAVPDQVDAAFRQRAGEIEATATTPRQQLLFQQVRVRRQQAIRAIVDRHVTQEYTRFELAEVEATEANALNNIAVNALDEVRGKEEFARGVAAIRAHGPRLGLGPEQLQQRLETFQTAAYSAVIERLLSNGLDQQAKQRLDEGKAKNRIGGVALAKLEQQVDVATTAGTGLRTATALWATHAPPAGDDQTPIPLDTMEDAARQQFATDPKTYDATVKYLRERTAGVEAARKDRQEARAGVLWSAVADRVTLEQIRTMPAFLGAPGKLQADVVQAVVREAEHQADRSYLQTERASTAARRQEAARERDGWASLWHYDDPRVLSQMSKNQILALTPDLGVDHVNRLLQKQGEYAASAEKVRDATIDSDQFNSLAEGAGLEPFKAKKTTSERAILGRLRGTVEATINQEQQATGKVLTRERKGAIMTGLLDRHVTLSTWGSDPSVAAATVIHPTDQEKAYVPVAEIPDAALTQWVNVIRGRFPSAQTKTRAEILALYQNRVQRAHAAHVLGLGQDEELRRLEGR